MSQASEKSHVQAKLVAIVDVTSIRLECAVEGKVDVAVQSGGFCVDDLG